MTSIYSIYISNGVICLRSCHDIQNSPFLIELNDFNRRLRPVNLSIPPIIYGLYITQAEVTLFIAKY